MLAQNASKNSKVAGAQPSHSAAIRSAMGSASWEQPPDTARLNFGSGFEGSGRRGFPSGDIRFVDSAMQTVALVFVVARRYNVFVQRGSAAVLVSTVLSILTISALMILYDV
jgi:hypothetical protein